MSSLAQQHMKQNHTLIAGTKLLLANKESEQDTLLPNLLYVHVRTFKVYLSMHIIMPPLLVHSTGFVFM